MKSIIFGVFFVKLGLVSVDRYTSHETFSTCLTLCTHHKLWLKVSQRVSDKITLHIITCLSVCCFLTLSSSSLSLAPLLFSHCLLVLCPAHQLPCGRNRRGITPLHSRAMRSIAPWRYITIAQYPEMQGCV